MINKLIAIFLIMDGLEMGQTTLFDSLVTSGVSQIYNMEFENAQNTFEIV